MIPQNLTFINCQPHNQYFRWQLEVLITNFREHKISDKLEVIVWFHDHARFEKGWDVLEKKYSEVKFFYYVDEAVFPDDYPKQGWGYIPQIRPHSLKKHFRDHAERLKDKIFFYHDCDIIFNRLPDFNTLCQGDINWQSDTSGYLDYDYLERKELQGNIPDNEVINHLAKIGGITKETILSYKHNTGGAQYIFKGIDAGFWEDVERDCIEIYKYLHIDVNKKYFKSENEGFQSWCADMWAVNFNLWKRGKITSVTPLLDFSWATDNIEVFEKKPIFHNAGATSLSKNLFYKGAWIDKSPIGKPIKVSKNFASYKYVEAIQKVR